MLFEIIFMPRKRQQLVDRNIFLKRQIKNFKIKDSCLNHKRDTAAELMALDGMRREIKYNSRLKNTLAASYLLSSLGIYKKI